MGFPFWAKLLGTVKFQESFWGDGQRGLLRILHVFNREGEGSRWRSCTPHKRGHWLSFMLLLNQRYR